MKRIYKYPVVIESLSHTFSHLLPAGYKFLRAQIQNGVPQMWVEVNPDAPKADAKFGVWGTGQDIPDSAKYLGTFDHGPFVLHIYQL